MQKYAADVSAILETSEAHFTLFSPKEFHSREINVLGKNVEILDVFKRSDAKKEVLFFGTSISKNEGTFF